MTDNLNTLEEAAQAVKLSLALQNAGLTRGLQQRIISSPETALLVVETVKLFERHIRPYVQQSSTDVLSFSLKHESLGLSERTSNVLMSNGIMCVRDLIELTPTGLFYLRNFGRKALKEVEEALAKHELALRDSRFVHADV